VAREIQLLPASYRSTVKHDTVEAQHAAMCRELEHLRSEIKRLQGLIAFKDEKLLYTVRFFEDVLRENKPQSIDFVKRLISQLKGAAERQQGGL